MPANPLTRRLVTITMVTNLFLAVTLLAPLLAAAGFVVDISRWLVSRRPWVTVRCLAFLWLYLLGELWALIALFVTAPLPAKSKIDATYRLQETWAGWNFGALRWLFSLQIDVAGVEFALPGPVIVLSRHASMVDTLLPATLLSRPTGLRLRYVLKKELLVDPALDIAGNRLPNAFIDRASRDMSELEAIRALAEDLGPYDGVLIYPEGTRFSEAKLRRLRERARGDEETRRMTLGLRNVLPPKPGGTLALLDATNVDVVVLVHHGLEGLATVREIWGGDLVGSRISVRMWRIPRSQIPATGEDRVRWLYQLWSDIDQWVAVTSHGTAMA